jgi:hypothetical protein
MAANIFVDGDDISIVQRIGRLAPGDKRGWGRMSLPQMLEHCCIQLKLALSILPYTGIEGLFLYRTALGRWLSLYVIPWPRGFETPSKMNMEKNGMPVLGFEDERNELLRLLEQVRQQATLAQHPFYGTLNRKDWGRLIWKNIDHHLRQYGQ